MAGDLLADCCERVDPYTAKAGPTKAVVLDASWASMLHDARVQSDAGFPHNVVRMLLNSLDTFA